MLHFPNISALHLEKVRLVTSETGVGVVLGPTLLRLGHWLLLLALQTHWGSVLMSSRGTVEKQWK